MHEVHALMVGLDMVQAALERPPVREPIPCPDECDYGFCDYDRGGGYTRRGPCEECNWEGRGTTPGYVRCDWCGDRPAVVEVAADGGVPDRLCEECEAEAEA